METKVKCPNCDWSSRVTWLSRKNKFKCLRCGHEWESEKKQ